MVIDWISVDSSVFEAVAYRERERQLYLKFHGGRVWRYFEFPAYQYEELLASESLGRYFGKHIRGQFHEEEVEEGRIPRRRRSAQNPTNRSTANR